MAVKAEDSELGLIEALGQCVQERLPGVPAAVRSEFARQYYQWVPARDLRERNPLDLCGAVVSHLRRGQQRQPGETKVAVYNPDVERRGWHSPFTVVEIVSDDMPFIVDSVTMELSRQGYAIELLVHPVMRVLRDGQGELVKVLEHGETAPGQLSESIIHAEVARQSDLDRLSVLQAGVELVLEEVRAAVEDWQPMRARAGQLADELTHHVPPIHPREAHESQAFLRWLTEDNFTFLGYREYDLGEDESRGILSAVGGTGLGILRGASAHPRKQLSQRALELARTEHPLILTTANSRSTVHRPAYLDYVGVKRFGSDGTVTGEARFLGLYTTTAYKASPWEIPLLREKVERVLARTGFPPDSHDAKGLVDILESLPRDLLVQISTQDLFDVSIGILGLGERQRVRLFVTRDRLDRFVYCTLCLPRDRFNTENRQRAGQILIDAFGGSNLDWRLRLSESVLVRIDYVIHCPTGVPGDYDVDAIEAQVAEATRAWRDDLRAALVSAHGEQNGLALYARFADAFPAAYRADWSAAGAVADIDRIGELVQTGRPILMLYRTVKGGEDLVRAKLLSASFVSLSDVLPTFERLGAKVIDERPYEVTTSSGEALWIYDFGLACPADALQAVARAFTEAFLAVWHGELEDDGLNALVIAAGLTAREVTVIRAVARYLRQAPVAFSHAYMGRTLVGHPEITRLLLNLFTARFDPESRSQERSADIVAQLEQSIDSVESLDEDRILRSFVSVLRAMLRTNYFRREPDGRSPAHLSFKLDCSELGLLPAPRPRFEIFVYSPRVEGIHLRGGKVARGGLRWSDRREDFRTEVLGLMKAQMVKNAMIVPVGAKGGFVVKQPPVNGGRDEQLAEAIACYQTFLRGLLDLTDNYQGGRVISPERVVRYDDDDPYFVVAADKGTASFSDIANEVAAEYQLWLGDAFASGGSHGYDHKQMGITARGAWESVRRHFRELGTDVQREDFTVVGIGDMAGDVFGNGMLRSEHLRLVAAFNHQHIFLDPDPDPAAAYAERQRLFQLARSSWSDYDPSLISEGGGVFSRAAKSIVISQQAAEVLGIDAERLAPAELIRAILKAPADLLFNGGVGTYVKAADEGHAEVGDKANDPLRVDGAELRCRVVCEGGNLGFTQRGRIEYALRGGSGEEGGRINTDAIDNVAGVNCSDHEVNIKILLGDLLAAGRMDRPSRNLLLEEMTDSVAERVLYGSYTQIQTLSIDTLQAPAMVGVHARFIRHLEQSSGLRRDLEQLPDEKVLRTGRGERRGLVSPELATVLAYAKIELFEQLLESDVPEDPFLGHDLERYFPEPLPSRYREFLAGHRLRREIIATVIANQVVDRVGTTFVFRLAEETGAQAPQLVRAYAVAREVFAMRAFWEEVEGLDEQIDVQTQLSMLIEGRRLVERATRWLVRAHPESIDIDSAIRAFAPGAEALAQALPGVLQGIDRDAFERRLDELNAAGVPEALSRRVASMQALLAVFDIVQDAAATGRDEEEVMVTYFGLGSLLGLDWIRDRILELPRADHWQALARAALRDDLYRVHRALTREALGVDGEGENRIEAWRERNEPEISRVLRVLVDVKASDTYDTTTLPVILRELNGLVRED
jgi:glutamate dehydrogenase